VVAFIKPVDRNRQGIRRIPLLRSLAGSGDGEDFVPANPLSHPLPPVPDGEIADGENSVELTARIDRGGSVARVKYSDGNHRLSKVSANALSHWRFEPARQNGEPVESEMVVRFEFRKKP
jgi:protein TonB